MHLLGLSRQGSVPGIGALLFSGLLALASCGSGDIASSKGKADISDGISLNLDASLHGDGATAPKDSAVANEITDGTGLDIGPYDVVANCPGGALCPCSINVDCQSGLCLEDPSAEGGKSCAQACKPGCAAGYICANLTSGSSDIQQFCVYQAARLCDPCSSSKDCEVVGLQDSKCVDQGGLGRFCGVACLHDVDCPADYACKPVASVEGGQFKQCVRSPVKGSAAAFGECSCSVSAIKKQLSTPCFVGGNTGPAGAKCSGVRACGVNGLGACDAPAPATETCDGTDNDCDGQTDEATCDDSNPCTSDACAGKGGCLHQLNTVPCSDGNLCTFGDSCLGGQCLGGTTTQCNDGNSCTNDSCDPIAGCKGTPNTSPCTDGNECTGSDTCVGATCNPGPTKTCDDGNPCTGDTCSPLTGCAHTPNVAGCSDGNACTVGDQCQGAACKPGIMMVCDDGNACTDDKCSSATGCTFAANTVGCSDGNSCTLGDSCAGGVCKAGVQPLCNDGNICTDDLCTISTGTCVFVNNTASCNDGSNCTTSDVCSGGKCTSGPGCGANATCQGNGVDVSCMCNTGWVGNGLFCQPNCGDKLKVGTEQCDDGNSISNDGCSATCQLECGALPFVATAKSLGAIAHWAFDDVDNIGKESIYGLDGNVSGYVKGDIEGIVSGGKAIDLSGNGSIQIPYSAKHIPTSFSLSFWAIPLASAKSYPCPVAQRAADLTEPKVLSGWNVYYGTGWQFWFGNGTPGSSWTTLNSPPSSPMQAAFVVATHNSSTSTTRLYVNGAKVAESNSKLVQVLDGKTGLTIGHGAGDQFVGTLDDVTLYTGALSDSAVASLYQIGNCAMQ